MKSILINHGIGLGEAGEKNQKNSYLKLVGLYCRSGSVGFLVSPFFSLGFFWMEWVSCFFFLFIFPAGVCGRTAGIFYFQCFLYLVAVLSFPLPQHITQPHREVRAYLVGIYILPFSYFISYASPSSY